MSLIKLRLDSQNEVINSGWANPDQRKAGDKVGDFQVFDIADSEIASLVNGHTKLVGGHLIVDNDYTAPAAPVLAASGPSAEQQMINALGLQVAGLQKQLAAIKPAVTASTTAPTAVSTASSSQGASK